MPSPRIPSFLQLNRNFLLVVIGLPTVVAAVISAALPGYYLSTTTAIPANARFTDGNRFNGKAIQELYPVFGEADDLDRIYNLARSSSVANALLDSFSLVSHYGLNTSRPDARATALKRLSKNMEIIKTETGELKVSVWDRSPDLAASLANACLERSEDMYRSLSTRMYSEAKQKLEKRFEQVNMDFAQKQELTAADLDAANRRQQESHDLIDQLDLSIQSPPPAMMVIDSARPSLRPDKPDLILNTLATFLVSAFTAISALLLFTPVRNGDRP